MGPGDFLGAVFGPERLGRFSRASRLGGGRNSADSGGVPRRVGYGILRARMGRGDFSVGVFGRGQGTVFPGRRGIMRRQFCRQLVCAATGGICDFAGADMP
jgi:hypothetical protein